MTEKPIKQTKITDTSKIPGLKFKPGGSITISGNAKMILKIDDNEIELKNE